MAAGSFGYAAPDLGLGAGLASQVRDETDEERKKRQQQQQDTAAQQPGGIAASNPITDALDPESLKKKKAMQGAGPASPSVSALFGSGVY